MSGVTLNQVIKRYGDVQVIHGVDLDMLQDGIFVVAAPVSGPPGAIKEALAETISTGGVRVQNLSLISKPAHAAANWRRTRRRGP